MDQRDIRSERRAVLVVRRRHGRLSRAGTPSARVPDLDGRLHSGVRCVFRARLSGAGARSAEFGVDFRDGQSSGGRQAAHAEGAGAAEFRYARRPRAASRAWRSRISTVAAAGSFGGWIAASGEIAGYLRYYARTIAFSVGLPASCVGGAIAGLGIIRDHPAQLAKLRANIELFRSGLVSIGIANALKSGSAIVSAPVGNERTLRDVARELFGHGVFAEALPFPAVPRGQERIRFRVSAAHTQEELQKVLLAVEQVFGKFGVAFAGKPVGGQQQTSSGSRCEMASELSDVSRKTRIADGVDDPARIAELSFKAAGARGYPVPWLHRDDYEKVLRGQSQPVREASSFCHFVAGGSGYLRASVCASLEPQICTGNSHSTGALGHIHWLPGEETVLADLLAQAKQWLINKGVSTVFAPIQVPFLHLGGGIASQATPLVFPMLQPHPSPDLTSLLQNVGFQPDSILPHWRVDLAKASAALAMPEIPGIAIRSMDKAHLLREVSIIHPLISQSLAQLKYCGGFTLNALYAAAHDLRDLIISELWKIAEVDGKPAGFVGAFPDVNQALIEAGGSAGTTDIENLGWAMAGARRASIAWLGVASEFQGGDVGRALLKSVYKELLNRNFSEAWLHWEFVDGNCRTKDFLPPDGALIDRMDYTVFRWQSQRDPAQ